MVEKVGRRVFGADTTRENPCLSSHCPLNGWFLAADQREPHWSRARAAPPPPTHTNERTRLPSLANEPLNAENSSRSQSHTLPESSNETQPTDMMSSRIALACALVASAVLASAASSPAPAVVHLTSKDYEEKVRLGAGAGRRPAPTAARFARPATHTRGVVRRVRRSPPSLPPLVATAPDAHASCLRPFSHTLHENRSRTATSVVVLFWLGAGGAGSARGSPGRSLSLSRSLARSLTSPFTTNLLPK
jgi:hypothetical protein